MVRSRTMARAGEFVAAAADLALDVGFARLVGRCRQGEMGASTFLDRLNRSGRSIVARKTSAVMDQHRERP